MARLFRAGGGRERVAARVPAPGDAWLSADKYELLARRCDAALEKARRRGGEVVAGVTVAISPVVDPLDRVLAVRRTGEAWSLFAQDAHQGRCLASIGSVAAVSAQGSSRFDEIARLCGEVLDGAEIDDPADDNNAPPGAGTVWTGGFSFFDREPLGDPWGGVPAASFAIPEISIARDDVESRLTVNLRISPDDVVADLLVRAERAVGRLQNAGEGGPDVRVGRSESDPAEAHSGAPPEHYERAVAEALDMIAAGELEKVVLAREVVLRSGHEINVGAALRRLREEFPECTVFAIGMGQATFIGATPELLVRRQGRRASTLALAGSIRRGADEQTDLHLGEQLLRSAKDNREHALVTRRIERALGRVSAWTAVGEHPELVKVRNIQHLATPIRAQLTEPRPVIELAGMLHPTPAVGGLPWPNAGEAIRSLEGFNRGWYTGGVGWMDILEDGEFHVALRSALVERDRARLYAGAGVVAGSDPASELAETETKLAALLPVLASS
ncbi:MAG: isochorismate synthase [Actinobacteria bacterium]|nr:isochorismate synthase [Actinomycetota bacterium]